MSARKVRLVVFLFVVVVLSINIIACGDGGNAGSNSSASKLACQISCTKSGEVDQTCYSTCLTKADSGDTVMSSLETE